MGCGATSSDATVMPQESRSGTMPPPPSVLSLERVQVLCVLSADGRFDRLQLQSSLCDAAVKVARQDATMPVQMIGVGDPNLLDPTAISLLVHASITTVAGQPVLVIATRPYRARPEQTDIFGPAPVAVPIGDDFEAAAESAMRTLIPPLLPWRSSAIH